MHKPHKQNAGAIPGCKASSTYLLLFEVLYRILKRLRLSLFPLHYRSVQRLVPLLQNSEERLVPLLLSSKKLLLNSEQG